MGSLLVTWFRVRSRVFLKSAGAEAVDSSLRKRLGVSEKLPTPLQLGGTCCRSGKFCLTLTFEGKRQFTSSANI